MGGGTGMCLLFKVHQEAPGDPDQVQPPAPPPAPFGSLNLACPGPRLPPHAPGGSPLSPWTLPGSRPQMASSSPASSSHPCFCLLDPSYFSARGNRNTVMKETQKRSLPPPVGSVPGTSRRTWSFFSGYFIIRPLPRGWKSPAVSSLLV